MLKMVFVAFPLEAATTPPDVKLLYQKVDELIQKQMDTIPTPQTPGGDSNVSLVSFVLLVIRTLTEVQSNFIDPTILVRILQRLAREMGPSSGSHVKQVCICFLFFISFVHHKVQRLLVEIMFTSFCFIKFL